VIVSAGEVDLTHLTEWDVGEHMTRLVLGSRVTFVVRPFQLATGNTFLNACPHVRRGDQISDLALLKLARDATIPS
jgi:hypothetical protein